MSIQSHPKYALLQTFVDALIVKVRNKQADYFVAKGMYFQGIRTPIANCSGDTNEQMAYGLHPDRTSDSWNTFDPTNYKANTKIPANIRIDIYQSAAGHGWILTIELWKAGLGPDVYEHDGDHWVFRHHEGPEPQEGILDEWYIQSDDPI